MKGAKNVGIPGVTIPSKTCDDDNCPFHGTLRVRGIILEGTIVKFRANKTAVFEREYLYYDKKYKRYERRRSRIHVHVPPCLDIKEGDRVIIGETRPIAKSVAFVVLGKVGGQNA
ncbi:MAG: 30S ribosomal protein S17 [Sulfolobales archaeon]|nr:30S ribosomal protein S17 [Sulfolobales archaeon]MCG2893590.1 30S ribosomal protein S17 [Sulfolobales archaeon]MCG2910863.1 30S ribosomal protein S17 [Sulfolobales archaeon]MCQ4343641.1 30S ribosomal protein S17 [Sulfolobales archaeon]